MKQIRVSTYASWRGKKKYELIMRTGAVGLLGGALCALGIFIGGAGMAHSIAESNEARFYNGLRVSEGVCVSTSYEDKTLTAEIETSDGNVWAVEDILMESGDAFTVVFDTCGTDEAEDDIILGITTMNKRYLSYTEE